MTRALFALSAAAVLYVYVGYPALVAVLARLRRREVRKGPFEPKVSILMAAHDEREGIAAALENKLALDYPAAKMELIVVSDASSDGTDELVRSFAGRGVRLIRQEPRAGKTAALGLAAAEASGELLLFSDANSLWEREALRRLAEVFRDPEVGYATGRMVYGSGEGADTGEGCGAYMKYENRLREMETLLGSIVGVDGGIDAVRRSLWEPMRPDQLPDLILPLRVVERGWRVVYEPAAVLREPVLDRAADEYRMRARVTLRALWALWDMRALLNPFRHGIYSLQLFSHKVLRYGAFLFLALLWVSSALLAREGALYLSAFAAQSVFYLGAFWGHRRARRGGKAGLWWPAYYLALVNLASAHAFLRFLAGQKQVLWSPRTG